MRFVAWPAGLIFVAVLTTAATVCHCNTNSSTVKSAAVWETPWEDGGVVPAGRLPYVASISPVGNTQHICTGILVHPLFVLTLSRCVEEQSVYSAGKRPLVNLGLTHVGTGTKQVDKETFVVETTFINEEVALLKLDRHSRKPHPRILSDQTILRDGNQNLVAVGWGSKMVELGQEIFGCLRVETTHYVSANVCNRPNLMNGEVAKGHFCGFNPQQYASCVVDSGAPVLLPHRADNFLEEGGIRTLDFLVGINFGGAVCGKAAKPDEYVDVRGIEPWIKDTIRKEAARLPLPEPADLEGVAKNDSGGTKDDVLRDIMAIIIQIIQERTSGPGHIQGSDYFPGAILTTICIMCITMLQACWYKPRSERGLAVVGNVVEHILPDGRCTSTPATTVPNAAPAQDHQRRQENSTSAFRTVDGGGTMDLERIRADAPPPNGILPDALESPFEEQRKRLELRSKFKMFPFFNLDMEASATEVKMFINQSLGHGGSGTVFPGMLYDSEIGRERTVAIKKMAPLKMTGELHIAKVVCKDRHPNIVQILGARLDKVELHNGHRTIIEGYMIMEQMSHNLRSALEDPGVILGLSRAQALDILMGVASGLKHLHQLHVVHRDVKPGNVLLALAIKTWSVSVEVQAVKLTDFDLSGVYEDNQVSVGICGTPGYMAPELRQDDGAKVDGKALDIFAFGLLICEVMGGSKAPMLTSCPREWGAHVQGVADLAVRCTSQDPTQRPSAAEAFQVLDSVKSSPWFCSAGHLSRKLTDIIRLLQLGSNSSRAFGDSNLYGGLSYRECIKLLVAVARELHSQRLAVAKLTAEADLGNCLFVDKIAKDGGSHDYRAVFVPPERVAPALEERRCPVQELSASIDTPMDNTSSLAKLMNNMFVASKEDERLLRRDAQLPPELADLIEAVKTGRNGDTFTSVADQLQAALDGGHCWLIKRAEPCRRPSNASGSGGL